MNTLLFSDSHLHLDFLADGEHDLKMARLAGVHRFLAVGVAAEYFPRLCHWQREQGVLLALGLHPLYSHQPQDLSLLETYLRREKIVAIGEIGLDGSPAQRANEAQQMFYFERQLRLAKDYDLPVLLHARSALEQVLAILKKEKIKRFLVHAFTGSDVQLQRLLDLGGYVGIGGTLTYRRAQRLRRQMANIDRERYVLESDAPDQPLSGWQGRDNAPQRLPLIAQTLADLRQVSLRQISADSEANLKRFLALNE